MVMNNSTPLRAAFPRRALPGVLSFVIRHFVNVAY